MTTKALALALIAAAGLAGAGCGSGDSTATGTGAATVAGASTGAATARDKAVKFSECLRTHGVPDFPDPDADGEFAYGVSVTPAVWRKAVVACKDLQPPGSLSAKRDPKQQSAALRFAQCMRESGVKDFPDPVNGDPLVDTNKIPSSNQPGGMTILDAAMAKCGDVGGIGK